jgi:hypothetical protein
LQTTYPSARAFVEILLKGSSKVTREELAQIPADRKAAFINEVAVRLRITKRRTVADGKPRADRQ